MVRNKLTDKVCVEAVIRAGKAHFVKHSLRYRVKPAVIKADIALVVLTFFALAKQFFHALNAFGLFRNNAVCHVLERNAGRIPQKIFGHFYCCLMVRYHLIYKILRDTAARFRLRHFIYHAVKNLIVAGKIILNNTAEFILIIHSFTPFGQAYMRHPNH